MNVSSSVLYGWLAQSKNIQPQIFFFFEISAIGFPRPRYCFVK